MSDSLALHASCVVVGEAGILLRGPSGSGKSTLARRLVDEARRRGLFSCLVGDDRVSVASFNGRLVARGSVPLQGIVEARGLGLLRLPHEMAAVVRLVVDVGGAPLDRLPSDRARLTDVMGIAVPFVPAADDDADRVLLHLRSSFLHQDGNPTCTDTF